VDAIIRVGVVTFAIVALSGLLLGSAGRLTIAGCLVLQTLMWAASMFGPARASGLARSDRPAIPVVPVAICAALLSFAAGFAMTHSPLTLYDSISYHLFFAARWVQDGTLSIIPTPFSDVA
jgi:hypothetical protein